MCGGFILLLGQYLGSKRRLPRQEYLLFHIYEDIQQYKTILTNKSGQERIAHTHGKNQLNSST